ncbi:unnamed protein product, partial [Hapterophycus canaliculatus]
LPGYSRHLLPEISRSASPTPLSPPHGGRVASNIFGTGGNRNGDKFYHPRRRPGVTPVQALLLLSDWSIGHEVSAVTVSPFDNVSYLRAAIQADIVRHTRGATRETGASDSTGHRANGVDGSGCPLFTFFYADGVAIHRGQEERLSVKDIAIKTPSPTAGAAADCFELRWEDKGSGDGERNCTEMTVFLRASESGTEQAGTGDGSGGGGGGGVLHRWESLQAGAWGNEAFWRSPASTGSQDSAFPKGGGPCGSSSSSMVLGPTSSSCSAGNGGQKAEGQGYDVPGFVGGAPLRTGSMGSSSLAVGIRQHQSRRFSVSFDESKAARRQMIQEQVILLAASKVTLIAKVFRGYQARVLFQERLHFHRQASKIQLCARQRAAKKELGRRARRREKAVKIQCLARSRHSRREAALRRDRHVAATRIQGSARSKAAKNELSSRRHQHRREAAAEAARKEKEEEEAREQVARELAELHRIEEEEAAIARIQSFARTAGAKKEARKRREHKKATVAKMINEQDEAALQLQCFSRVQAAKIEASERRKRKQAAARVRDIKNRREDASVKITALARGRRGRRRALKMRREKNAAAVIQKTAKRRRGRTRSPTRSDRHRAAKSKETAATLIQKVARGNSDRALFRNREKDLDDTGLYGRTPDKRQSGNTAREQQQGGGTSTQEEDGPKHVEFSTGASSYEIAENIAGNMALAVDERVRNFVAVQATVRRADNVAKVAPGGERDEDCVEDGRMKNDRDFPTCAEPEQRSSVSESDFLLSSSRSGSLDEGAKGTGQYQVQTSGFQSGY